MRSDHHVQYVTAGIKLYLYESKTDVQLLYFISVLQIASDTFLYHPSMPCLYASVSVSNMSHHGGWAEVHDHVEENNSSRRA